MPTAGPANVARTIIKNDFVTMTATPHSRIAYLSIPDHYIPAPKMLTVVETLELPPTSTLNLKIDSATILLRIKAHYSHFVDICDK